MRIIGGRHRGTHLAPVGEGDPKAHLRPTSDRVREAIFNLLVNGAAVGGNPLPAARVLDLFAGTGALGLEALSRGAAHVTFVDNGAVARTLLRRNIEILRATDSTDTLHRDATKPGDNRGAPCSVIFLDPPYGKSMGEVALCAALAGNWLAPGALVVWEESNPPLGPKGFALLDQRKYGDTLVTLLKAPE